MTLKITRAPFRGPVRFQEAELLFTRIIEQMTRWCWLGVGNSGRRFYKYKPSCGQLQVQTIAKMDAL